MRIPRRLVVIILLAIPLVAALAIYLLIDPVRLKPLLLANLNQTLRRQTSIDQLSVQFFPPSLKATGLTIADDPAFSSSPFFKASNIEIRPSLLPLISGRLEIDSIRVEAPLVELIQNQRGVWNYSTLGSNEPNAPGPKLALLQIDKATLGIRPKDSDRQVYSNLSLALRNYAEAQPFSFRLEALLPSGKSIGAEGTLTSGKQQTTLKDVKLALADLKASVSGELSSSGMNLRLQIPKSNIRDAAPLFLPAGTTANGEVSANIEAQGSPSQPRLSGRIDIANFEVSGGGLKHSVRTPKLGMALTADRISLEPANISGGSTQLMAYGVISQYTNSPVLEATFLAPSAKLAELVSIARAYGISAVDGIEARGDARLRIRVHGPLSGKAPLAYAGTGSLSEATIQLPSLAKPIEIASTNFRFESSEASISSIAARIGESNVTGNIRVANFNSPVLNFDLASDNLHLDELRSLIRTEPNSKPNPLTASGNLKIANLKAAELTLTQVNAKANFNKGHLVLDPLNASLYGGRHSGSMDIDLRPAQPQVSIQSQLERIESSLLLAAATSLKGIISGPFGANLNLKFSTAEPTQLAKSMQGKVSLNFTQGRIASFNLTNELASLARFVGFQASGDRFTQFVGLTGDLEIQNGQATTQNLKLELANMTASLTGGMNLADQTLDLKLLSVLDRRYSEQVGGSKIGGFMTAALSNSSGNLMIPATIRGTFAKPVLAPDPGGIAKLKLQNPRQMMDSVNSVIDLFKKKKP